LRDRRTVVDLIKSMTDQQDADFEVSVAEAVDKRDVSRKVLNPVVAFAGSTDLSFQKTARDATFKFVSVRADLRS
jgi:hypothetical protein